MQMQLLTCSLVQKKQKALGEGSTMVRSATIHWPALTDVEKHFIWKFKMQCDSKNDAFQRNFLAFLFMFLLFIKKIKDFNIHR